MTLKDTEIVAVNLYITVESSGILSLYSTLR